MEDEALEGDESEEAAGTPPPTTTRTTPAAARHQATRAVGEPAVRQIAPLSLGVGMALMGLGIGFLGVRLRGR